MSPQLIQNYVRTSGMSRPLTAADITYLTQAGVREEVINVMMTTPGPQSQAPTIVQASAPAPVIIEEHYYDPWYGPHYGYYHGPHYRHCGPPGPRVSWGVSVGH